MTSDKFKKVDKEYCLSDSSINCYGYRLLTSGYQLAEYAKNPIGYYMHDRDGGVVVRWENLRIEGDCIFGKPCINLSNPRGQQTLDEAEAGFLNAASVGHIVVLEYSNDSGDMLEGQTGPTIIKWFNRECSLVDIPGNGNALTSLFDNDGNSLKLADLCNTPRPEGSRQNNENSNEGYMEKLELSLQDLAALTDKGYKITDLASLTATLDNLKAEADKVPGLKEEIKTLKAAELKNELEQVFKDSGKKITTEQKTLLSEKYADDPKSLKALLATWPGMLVTDLINNTKQPEGELAWSWDDYQKNDATGKKLKALMTDNPTRYKEIFDEKFVKE